MILVSIGWGFFWASFPALLAAIGCVVFFAVKARREEALLRGHFPECVDYMQSTWRFIPWIY